VGLPLPNEKENAKLKKNIVEPEAELKKLKKK
jgi:hypothetical protein